MPDADKQKLIQWTLAGIEAAAAEVKSGVYPRDRPHRLSSTTGLRESRRVAGSLIDKAIDSGEASQLLATVTKLLGDPSQAVEGRNLYPPSAIAAVLAKVPAEAILKAIAPQMYPRCWLGWSWLLRTLPTG